MRGKKWILVSCLCCVGALCACSSANESSDSAAGQQDSADTAVTTAASVAQTETTTEPLPAPDPKAITFDTPSLYTAHSRGINNYTDDESRVNLSIVSLDGDSKLKVEVLDKNDKDQYAIPKIVFDLPALVGLENVPKIGKISADITSVARGPVTLADGTSEVVVGNCLGALSGDLAAERKLDEEGNLLQSDWVNHYEFKLKDFDNPQHTWRVEAEVPKSKLPVNGYEEGFEGATLVVMRWAQSNQADLYLDNITFFDKDGAAMDIIYDATAETMETVTETLPTKPAETTTAGGE